MFRRYAWSVLGVNLLVILWGAFVRATGSGAGCGSHWPTCNGEVVPRAASIETAIELTHRVTSGLALILVLGLVIAAFRSRPKGHPARLGAASSMLFILLEAAIGAGIVLLELVANNTSVARVYWMSLHLVNTFLLVASLSLTARWAAPEARRPNLGHARGTSVALGGALLGVVLVGVTGAIAALGDTVFPAEDLASGVRAEFDPSAHWSVRLRVAHPFVAMAVGVMTMFVAAWAAARCKTPSARRLASAVVMVFVAQLVGGLINVLLLAPVWMQLVHLAMADGLWILLILLLAEAVDVPAAIAPATSVAQAPAR